MGRALDFAAERERMVSQLVRAGYLKNPRVRDAFRAVSRERFVQPGDSEDAYVDVPLPIGAGHGEVRVVVGDGSLGYPEGAPYDCIMATAGAPRIPGAWPPQLSPRGRIVAPVGSSRHGQVLVVATRRPDGTLRMREGTSCAFVPLVGAQAWPD